MKIYTKTGDKGETSLIGGRVKKSDERIEAIGSLDEANASIGIVVSTIKKNPSGSFTSFEKMRNRLIEIQHHLFDCGADMANAKKNPSFKINESHVKKLEDWMDEYEKSLAPLSQFILPGGSDIASFLHSSRTIVRRAERNVIRTDIENPNILIFLNRLSDFLFVMARISNFILGEEDNFYQPDTN